MANRLKELRKRAGLTQEVLGEAIGTSGQQISRLERGERRLAESWIEKLAVALNIRPAALIDALGDLLEMAPGHREFAKDADEILLLKSWRTLSKGDREVFKKMLRGLSAPSGETDNVRRKG